MRGVVCKSFSYNAIIGTLKVFFSGWAGVPVKTKLVPVAEEESFEEVPPVSLFH